MVVDISDFPEIFWSVVFVETEWYQKCKRFLSYRNQFIDLQSKSREWFLFDRDHRHEKVKSLISILSHTNHWLGNYGKFGVCFILLTTLYIIDFYLLRKKNCISLFALVFSESFYNLRFQIVSLTVIHLFLF